MHATCNNNAAFLAHLNATDVSWDPSGPELQRHQLFPMLRIITYPVPHARKTTPLKHTYFVHEVNRHCHSHIVLKQARGIPMFSEDSEMVFCQLKLTSADVVFRVQ